ncbi:MAG: patatin [Rhodospirillales bacterium 70-18]|nr:MAG: patatin [Rhodospirillales bacterium 70-18]
MTDTTPPPPAPQPHGRRVALVLQGGGALGSYQAGVYEALAAAGCLPDWVAGISIGAINAALIAGNPPERRGDALRAFWEQVSAPTALWPELPVPGWAQAVRQGALMSTLVFGQPGFFRPAPQVGSTTSYYDTSGLKGTLERLCDFDRINARTTRLSVGAVNVRTGNFAYFDNAQRRIVPEHIMASGALPPGFPPVEIDGEQYWDGGLVSNTPLQYVLDDMPRQPTLAFQVDLFSARGPVPTNLEEVEERRKDIQYSSRTRMGVDHFRQAHAVRRHVGRLLDRLPPELRADPVVRFLERQACQVQMDVVNLIYRPTEPQGATKDFEFSRPTMLARWDQGRSDAAASLAAAPWREAVPPQEGARSFDVLGPRK